MITGKFSREKVLETMQKPDSIRNISVIAHVDHGKSTLTDQLLKMNGLIAEKHAGTERATDTHQLEKDKGITIQSTAVSLYYELNNENVSSTDEKSNVSSTNGILVNLIDSPGHVDFSSEVTAALRLTDGAIVVVDCLEGVCVQTETVLRQSLLERVKPVLFLNKLDRVFLETKPNLEDVYVSLKNTIESVDVITQTYSDSKMGKVRLSPIHGNVGFGSGLHGWGFTLSFFAKMYSHKLKGFQKRNMMSLLWGNNYYDSKNNEWLTQNKTSDGRVLERSFVVFILRPIRILCDAIMSENKKVYEPIIQSLKLKFSKKQLMEVKKPKDYLKLVLSHWLPCGDSLLDMTVNHLPSPVVAQKYRCDVLYTGDLNSKEASHIRNCDINGEFSMYVSKMVPMGGTGKFVAFGRVFSGSIKKNQEIRIMTPEYSPPNSINETEEEMKSNQRSNNRNVNGLSIKKAQTIYLMMAKEMKSIPVCYAGNLCAISGLDGALIKCGSISSSDSVSPFRTMKFSVSPVVQYAVNVTKASDLPKLLKGLRKLEKCDPILKVSMKNNENIIAGAGELHLEISLARLQDEFMNGIKVIKSEPIVSLRESVNSRTVTSLKTDKQELNLIVTKSPNNLNRLYMSCEPLTNKFSCDLENGIINISDLKNKKVFSKLLSTNKEYSWNKGEAEKIWTFGVSEESRPNVLCDLTKGETRIKQIRPHMVSAFTQITEEGILCQETLRSVRFDLRYVKVHSDNVHSGASQIIPAARRCYSGCMLESEPIFMEPMYSIEVNTDLSCQNKVINAILQKRGTFTETIFKQGTMILVKGFLPVLESFGFTQYLREKAKFANPQMTFSHWNNVKGNPLENGTYANELLMKIRKRKGLKLEVPTIKSYFDRVI